MQQRSSILCLLFLCFFSSILPSQTFYTRHLPIPPLSLPASLGACAPIVRTSDGGYLLHYGYGYPGLDGAGPSTAVAIKTDNAFQPLWRKPLGGGNGHATFTYADGTTILYGNSGGLNIEKVDLAGQSIWAKRYQRSYPDEMATLTAAERNGNLLFGGYIVRQNGFGWSDYWHALLIETDTAGNLLSADTLEFPGFTNTTIDIMAVDAAGNTLVAGGGGGISGGFFVAKLDPNNVMLACTTLATAPYSPHFARAAVLPSGDFVIGGYIYHDTVGTGVMTLMGFAANGSYQWSKTYPDPSAVSGMQLLPNGHLLVSASHRNTYGDTLKELLMEVDATNGNVIWARRYYEGFTLGPAFLLSPTEWVMQAYGAEPILFNTDNQGYTTCPFTNSNIAAAPLSVIMTPSTATWYPLAIGSGTFTPSAPVAQTGSDTCAALAITALQPAQAPALRIAPNPSGGRFAVEAGTSIDALRVVDALGRVVYEAADVGPGREVELKDAGIYFVTAVVQGQSLTRRVVVAR